MDTSSVKIPAEFNLKLKKKRKGKTKANDGFVVKSMDHEDKNVHDSGNGNDCMITEVCSEYKLLEVDPTAKLSQENAKTGVGSITNPLEKPTKSKKRRKRAKEKAESKLEPQSMDCANVISNLSLADPSDAYAGCEIKNVTDLSQESGCCTGKGLSFANPAELNVKLKKRKRRKRKGKKANDGCVVQSMGQEDKNVHDFESEKNGVIAKDCSRYNLLEVDSTTRLSQENPETGKGSTTNPLEKSTKSKKRRMRRAKRKAESKLESQIMDLNTTIISNLSLADSSDAYVGSEIKNATDVSQESGYSIGKGSSISVSSPLSNSAEKDVKLISNNQTASSPNLAKLLTHNICHRFSQETVESGRICNKQVTEHRSSEVINEAENCLLAYPYQVPRRRKLLILDVNGLLVDIIRPPPKGCKADTNLLGRAIFKRPFYYDYLEFCFERFDVGIWSSRTKKVLDKVVDYLLGDLKHKLVFCWDVLHCTETKFKTLQNRHKPLVFKELRKLWEKHDPNLPWEKGDYDESNTLLIDDSPYKALLNPMHTGVFPGSYTYKNKRDKSLGPGGSIRVYLEGLATADNVQHYVAQHPFGQSAIKETDPSWKFYSGVLQSFIIQSNKGV